MPLQWVCTSGCKLIQSYFTYFCQCECDESGDAATAANIAHAMVSLDDTAILPSIMVLRMGMEMCLCYINMHVLLLVRIHKGQEMNARLTGTVVVM